MIDPTTAATARNPSIAYDGGAERPILSAQTAGGMAASAMTLVAATAGMRVKVLACNVICSGFTTAGSLYLRNLTGGATIYWIARIAAVNENHYIDLGGTPFTQTAVASGLEAYFDGNGNFGVAVTYYLAP